MVMVLSTYPIPIQKCTRYFIVCVCECALHSPFSRRMSVSLSFSPPPLFVGDCHCHLRVCVCDYVCMCEHVC